MSDQLNNSQNLYLQQLLALEQAKMAQYEKEQSERNRKEKELQDKATQVKIQDEAKKKAQSDKLAADKRERDALINGYLNTDQLIDDDGIDGRMTRQLISHGRKAKDSITYQRDSNKNQQLNNQAQRDELYEQSNLRWWDQN